MCRCLGNDGLAGVCASGSGVQRLARWKPPLTVPAACCTIPVTMPGLEADNKRRSSRVFTRIRLWTTGRNVEGHKFREAAETIVVSAHGALLYLHEPLEMGALIVLVNPATQEEQECRVVYLGDAGDKGQRVGVEFLSPAPRFWGIEFAPGDWPSRSPSAPAD